MVSINDEKEIIVPAQTLSVGSIVLKVFPPESGLLPSQEEAHWFLWEAIASSSALP